MQVTGGKLHGVSISDAKLDVVDGLDLFEIQRGSQVVSVPDPSFELQTGDVLLFSGSVGTMIEKLYRVGGLVPMAHGQAAKLPQHSMQRKLYTAIVANDSRLIGRTCHEVRALSLGAERNIW